MASHTCLAGGGCRACRGTASRRVGASIDDDVSTVAAGKHTYTISCQHAQQHDAGDANNKAANLVTGGGSGLQTYVKRYKTSLVCMHLHTNNSNNNWGSCLIVYWLGIAALLLR